MLNFGERLFNSNVTSSLERILEVKSLGEIQNRDQVILPDEIFDKARMDLGLTIDDSRERATYFEVSRGRIRIRRTDIGQPLAIRNGRLDGSVGTSWIRALYEYFLAKPIPVHLHTHPTLTGEYLKNWEIQETNKRLSDEQLIVLANEIGKFLSPADLGHMEAKGGFVRSMLLASNGGFTWVINPNPGRWPNFTTQASSQYERYFTGIFNLKAQTMHMRGNTNIDRDSLDKSLLGKLYGFCYQKGFVGFYNRDKNSPELTTLRHLPY